MIWKSMPRTWIAGVETGFALSVTNAERICAGIMLRTKNESMMAIAPIAHALVVRQSETRLRTK